MKTLEQYQQNRRVIEDFTTRTLAAISGDFARLLYVATLRDLASGRYCHAGLSAVYPEEAVQESLAHCHEELFARILETPLNQQENDLRLCLGAFKGDFLEVVARWRDLELYRVLLPSGMPAYMRRLFCANLRALLGLLAQDQPSGERAA